MALSEDDQRTLLRIARATLEAHLKKEKPPALEPTSPALHETRGAFVTLEKQGQLRGCIGRMAADRPLFLVVCEMAIAAATQDPRFPPVRPEELSEIEIEISALTPFKKITDLSEIQIGEHGLVVSDGKHRGVLLPQVATREGWDRETFLSQTCRKAGLPPDSWKTGKIKVEIFSAEVYRESP